MNVPERLRDWKKKFRFTTKKSQNSTLLVILNFSVKSWDRRLLWCDTCPKNSSPTQNIFRNFFLPALTTKYGPAKWYIHVNHCGTFRPARHHIYTHYTQLDPLYTYWFTYCIIAPVESASPDLNNLLLQNLIISTIIFS